MVTINPLVPALFNGPAVDFNQHDPPLAVIQAKERQLEFPKHLVQQVSRDVLVAYSRSAPGLSVCPSNVQGAFARFMTPIVTAAFGVKGPTLDLSQQVPPPPEPHAHELHDGFAKHKPQQSDCG